MNKPFFSVIVPAFNSALFIRKGLDSVRDQSFKDYELIIVCDKCEDNTAEIARKYTDKVYEIDHDIDGPGVNLGLDKATGEWVLFLDDDDWFLHEFVFEELANMARYVEDKIDIIAFSFIMKGIGYQRNTPGHKWPALWNKCWRREFIGDERLPAWEHSNDYGFAVKMHPRARFAFWDMPLYYYNFMRPGCVSEKIKNGQLKSNVLPEDVQGIMEDYRDSLNGELAVGGGDE